MNATAEFVRCTKCTQAKPRDKFDRHPDKKNGLQSWCKECNATYVREARRAGRYRDRETRQRETFRAAETALRARHRAEFDELYDTELIRRGLA